MYSCISSIQFKSEFQRIFRLLIAVNAIFFFYFTVAQEASFPVKYTIESMVYCSHLSNMVSASWYEELAAGLEPIRNVKIFWMINYNRIWKRRAWNYSLILPVTIWLQIRILFSMKLSVSFFVSQTIQLRDYAIHLMCVFMWLRDMPAYNGLPADVLWGSLGRNECVTNEPQKRSAGRLSLQSTYSSLRVSSSSQWLEYPIRID